MIEKTNNRDFIKIQNYRKIGWVWNRFGQNAEFFNVNVNM